MKILGIRLSVSRILFVILMALGLWATILRFYFSLAASTNLTDRFPWGIWVGFDMLCGVGLAAGGFTLAAIVHVFNIKTFRPVVRPAILTAFLGYLLVAVALMFELGRPYRIWHPLIMWNPHSVMFEVGWCVMLYLTVLSLEFLPVPLERFGMVKAQRALKKIMLPVVILGVVLSTLHQSSLGSMFLIMKGKLHPLWYSPLLPVLFYISAIAVGLAMTIFASWHSAKAFGRELEFSLIQKMARVLAVVIAVYLAMRFLDLIHSGALSMLNQAGPERILFAVEIILIAVSMLLLFRERTLQSPVSTYVAVVIFLLGFVMNRMNVGVTALERSAGITYIPKWPELAITFAKIAAGFAIFQAAAHYLPVFEPQKKDSAGPAPGNSKLAPAELAIAKGD